MQISTPRFSFCASRQVITTGVNFMVQALPSNCLKILLLSFAICISAPVFAQTSTPTQVSSTQSAPTVAVKEFYRAMKERRFRDAIMMSNWRSAVETLSSQEVEDLKTDFEALAAQAAGVETTGEQISGEQASVFVKGADPETGAAKVDEIKLRRENGKWVIVMGDAQTESVVRREGKNYFFNLRIENHHAYVNDLLQEVIKAEMIYSLGHAGLFTDLKTLVSEKLLQPEILGTETGYRFRLMLSDDKKKYAVNAEPVQYGKTGRLSFLLESSGGKDGKPQIKTDDNSGQPFAVKN
jgi:hypothetical protein